MGLLYFVKFSYDAKIYIIFLFQQSSSPNDWNIILGRQNQEGSNPNEVSRTVAQIVLHPVYDSDTNDNDIALLRLTSPVNFTNYIRPVCLAASDSFYHNGTDSWVTGWGKINEGSEETFAWRCQWHIVLWEIAVHCRPKTLFFQWKWNVHNESVSHPLPQNSSPPLRLCRKWRFQFWVIDSVTASIGSAQSQTTCFVLVYWQGARTHVR